MSILVITAPDTIFSIPNYSIKYTDNVKLFLAGGITNCPNWQKIVIDELKKFERLNVTILNPRRENFPIDKTEESERQIHWEFEHLRNADVICFWFSEGSDNPIVLYELGMWGNSRTDEKNRIVVGCHPNYKRKKDVMIQTELSRLENGRYIKVHEDFQSFIKELTILC